MRKTFAIVAGVVASTALAAAALPAPNGLAPFPGGYNPYAAPPPPQPGNAANGSSVAPAPVAAPKPVNCLWNRRLRNWSAIDDRSMMLYQGSRRYLVTFSGTCRESRFEQGLVVDRRFGSCLGPGDRVTFGSPSGRQWDQGLAPCYIKKIEELPRQAQN